ncbi:MAG TPA: low affinity iron permease family protein [Gaiellaceae bacterium]|jgi:low affinity Fe/Cu permease|nr:low affinity iron permease family protein [Gaiellaceae bacterium]
MDTKKTALAGPLPRIDAIARAGGRAARRAPALIGSPYSLVSLLAATIVWLMVGPAFGFSNSWLRVPSAGASILALILVVLLQYSQNRDTRAIQLKLDEVIRSVDAARNELLGLERLSDTELDRIEDDLGHFREGRR